MGLELLAEAGNYSALQRMFPSPYFYHPSLLGSMDSIRRGRVCPQGVGGKPPRAIGDNICDSLVSFTPPLILFSDELGIWPDLAKPHMVSRTPFQLDKPGGPELSRMDIF